MWMTILMIFLLKKNSREERNMLKNAKKQKSTDYNCTDMTIVKEVFEGLSKPLIYICNLSFQTGPFPKNMKIAAVLCCTKLGTNITLPTTNLSLYFHNSPKC